MAAAHRRVSIYLLAAEAFAIALAAFTPLALGGAPLWALWPVVLLSSASLALACVGCWRMGQRVTLPLLALVPLVGAAVCLWQLLPLPAFALRLLSPNAAELREFVLVPLGLTQMRPLSLDPPSTWRELAKHLSYLGAFLAAAQVARHRAGRQRLFMAVAAVGLAVSVVGLFHKLVDAQLLFGFYAYQGAPPLLSTFGNPNHLAGYLILSSTVALGLALAARDRTFALLWGCAYVVMGAALLLSLSRGGIVFFVFAQLLLGALFLSRRAPPEDERRRWKPLLGLSGTTVAFALSVLAVGAYVAYEALLAEFHSADSLEKLRASKIEFWPMMFDAARAYWGTGLGRGAYELAFTRFQTSYPSVTFTHPENLVLQWWTELGLVPALAMFAAGAVGLGRLLRRRALGIPELAALAAVVGLVLHNLFDFNLELPACAATASLLLGAVSFPEPDDHSGWKAKKALGISLGVGLLALVALVPGRHEVDAAEKELSAYWAQSPSVEELRQRALGFIDRHPANYLFHDWLGRAYATQKGGSPREALAFVNRALYLRPLDAEAHRIAARSLLRLGNRNQAFLEFRLAYESAVSPGPVLDEALRYAKGLDELRRLVAPEPSPLREVIVRLDGLGRREEATTLLTWALEELRARTDTVELWLVSANFHAAKQEYDAALADLDQAEQRNPRALPVHLTRAQVLTQMGQRDQALALLKSLVTSHPDDVNLAFTLAQHHHAAGKPALAREALERVRPFLSSLEQRTQLFGLEGATYEAETRYARALLAYQSAARLSPTAPHLQYQIARMYEQLAKYPEAMDAVRAGIRLDGPAAGEAQKGWLSNIEAKRQAQLDLQEMRLLEGPASDAGK